MEFIQPFVDRFISLGTAYGVNPFIFGAIYVGAIPLFTYCIAWLVRNYRHDKPIVVPALLAGCCFVSAYVYLIIAGQNVPAWVYVFIIALLIVGAWSTYKKVNKKLHSPEQK